MALLEKWIDDNPIRLERSDDVSATGYGVLTEWEEQRVREDEEQMATLAAQPTRADLTWLGGLGFVLALVCAGSFAEKHDPLAPLLALLGAALCWASGVFGDDHD